MEKQLLPLLLMRANEGEPVDGITRVQKLLFLAQEESDILDEEYDFKAGKYGPYSKPLYDDVDRLVEEGFIDEEVEKTVFGDEKQVYELTDKGERAVKNALDSNSEYSDIADAITEIKKEYNDKGFNQLLEYVYTSYPEMAENSELSI